MKYKRKKMWKPWVLFIFIYCTFFLIPIGYTYLKSDKEKVKEVITDESKLKDIGYSLNDISLIVKNKKIKKYALSNSYNSSLMDYINLDGFDIDNINKYEIYKKNNKDAPFDMVIKLVNMNINEPYSDTLVSIINSKYFVKSRLKRYLSYSGNDVVKSVNCDIDRPFYTATLQTDTTKGILMLNNKYHYLASDYNGLNLVPLDYNYGEGYMNSEAYEAFKKLSDDARGLGLNILAKSTYRSYQSQVTTYNDYLNTNGLEWTDAVSARAGYSEHQTGLAVDVKTYSTYNFGDFLYTNEYQWMLENSYKYGFILRYPLNSRHLTGYDFEPWHYRYVGVKAAKIIHDEGLLFEEYYAYYVDKKEGN